jgi:predicted nucleotidyltransferase
MPTRLEALHARRAAERRAVALPRAIAALEDLRARGVDAGVIGSLARDRMREHSDVDFLVLDQGGVHWNDVVAIIERHTRPLPIHVVFGDSVRPDDRDWLLKDLKREHELRALAAEVERRKGGDGCARELGAVPRAAAG